MARQNQESFETRFTRLIDMLQRLSVPRGHTAKQLAAEYGVSERSIQRDFISLREARFPLEELGRGRGYRLPPDFRGSSQALKASEVLPMILGSRLLGNEDWQIALSKLRNFVVNGVEKRLTLEIPDRLVVAAEAGIQWLEPLATAITRRLQVNLLYRGNRDSSPLQRVVEPTTLVVRGSTWYFEAFDHGSGQARTFRLSRVQGCELLSSIQTQPPTELPAEPFHPWDLASEAPLAAVVEVSPALSAWLAENPAHPSQVLEDGRARYQVRCRPAFLRWLLSLEGARLVEPVSLLDELRGRIKALAADYR